MKRAVFLLLSVAAAMVVCAQRIQYSRETVRRPITDGLYLLANIGGQHHLLCFGDNKKPVVLVFDQRLQLQAKTEIDVRVRETDEIRIVPFPDKFFLYLHAPGKTLHRLFRVDSDGSSEDLSAVLARPADSAWNRSPVSFQLVDDGGELTILTHTYFDAVKNVATTVVKLDADGKTRTAGKAVYPFDKATDALQQITYRNGSLLVLKSGRLEDRNYVLDVFRVHVPTGQFYANRFSSGNYQYIGPSLRYNAADSSILVSSYLRAGQNTARFQRAIFFSRLDAFLQEKMSPKVVQAQVQGVATNFLLVQDNEPYWMTLSNFVRVRQGPMNTLSDMPFDIYGSARMDPTIPRPTGSRSLFDYNLSTGVQFILLNELFGAVADTVVANSGAIYDVQPRPFGQFSVNKKPYLVLIENLTASKRGLFLVGPTDQQGLATTSLPVYDRYEYFLPQLQGVKEGFLVPYRDGRDVGLLKIGLKD